MCSSFCAISLCFRKLLKHMPDFQYMNSPVCFDLQYKTRTCHNYWDAFLSPRHPLIQCAPLYHIHNFFLAIKHKSWFLANNYNSSLLFKPFLGSSHLMVYPITSSILLKAVYKMPAVWIKSQAFSTSCSFSFKSSVWAGHWGLIWSLGFSRFFYEDRSWSLLHNRWCFCIVGGCE